MTAVAPHADLHDGLPEGLPVADASATLDALQRALLARTGGDELVHLGRQDLPLASLSRRPSDAPTRIGLSSGICPSAVRRWIFPTSALRS